MTYWVGLGGNLGDPAAAIAQALQAVDRDGGRVLAVSPLYRTAPRDLEDQPAFVNAAARVAFPGPPPALLRLLKAVERDLGRAAGPRYGPRPIDLDILLWDGGAWQDADLTIPHPRLMERRFALVPLLALDPLLATPDGRSLAVAERALAGDPGQTVEPLDDPGPAPPG